MQSLGKGVLRLTVQRDEKTTSHQFGETTTKPKSVEGPLIRKFVLLERSGTRWKGRFESGRTPSAAEQAAIDEFESRLESAGTSYDRIEARPGDEWEAEASKIQWLKGTGGKVRIRFDRIERFRDEECAVLVGTLDFDGESESGGNTRRLVMKASFTSYRSLERYIDLEAVIEGTMKTASISGDRSITTLGPVRIVQRTEVVDPGRGTGSPWAHQ